MKPHRPTHPARRSRGVAVVEFALVLPLLLVMLFGVLELGRIVFIRQIMINVSREAANLASRGTPLQDAIAAVQASATPLDLETDGYVILSEVRRDANGNAFIYQQRAAGDDTQASRVGSGAGSAASLPPTPIALPPDGLSLFAAEVFYRADPITPLTSLIGATFEDSYYDVAFF
jgi:Flp pilus assembly protein TadG